MVDLRCGSTPHHLQSVVFWTTGKNVQNPVGLEDVIFLDTTKAEDTGILGLNDSREFQFPRITTHIARAMAGDAAGYARRHSGEISSVTLEFADTVISSLQFCPGGSLIILLREARTGPKSSPYRGSVPVHVYSRF